MGHDSGQKRKMILASGAMIVLILAAFTSPSLGLVGVAEAKKEKVDAEDDTLAHDHFPELADLDIKTYGFAAKNAYIEVYGLAGETLPEEEEHDEEGFGHAIAYVLNVVTSQGKEQTWAIDSHEAQHGGSGDSSLMWHAHRVHLTEHPVTGDLTCLNEVDEVTHAMTDGSRIIFEEFKVRTEKGTEAVVIRDITSAATVELHVLVEDPDDPPVGTVCIAEVSHVFDTADLGIVRDSRPR